jgi:hypothetical protein
VLGVLPAVARRRIIERVPRDLTAAAVFGGMPSAAHTEALLRAIDFKGTMLAEPLDAIVIGIPPTTAFIPRGRPNPVAAAYLGKSGDKLLCLADGGGVFASNDDGRTWKNVNAGLPQKGFDVGRLAVHPDDENIAYLGVSWGRDEQGHHAPGGVYKTVDGGKSWVEKSRGLAKLVSEPKNHNLISNYGAIALARSNPAVLYTCDASWSQGIIYKSTDGGDSWAPNCTRGWSP